MKPSVPKSGGVMTSRIITVSDSGYRGEREDESGPALVSMLEDAGFRVLERRLVPDEIDCLERALVEMCDGGDTDIILTTGGTGFAPRDVTPEATMTVIHREVPGIPEAMRAESLKKTPHAMLSRARAGIRGSTLIINMPGSPRACRECLEVILPALPHAVEVLRGSSSECARLRTD